MIEQVMEVVMPILFMVFLPLGIYIVTDVERAEHRWMNFVRRNSVSKFESPSWWNKIVMRLIGLVMILMGAITIVFNVLNLVRFVSGG